MARRRATVTVDRGKLELVRTLTGASSASRAIDVALAAVIRLDRLREDVAAHRVAPWSDEEISLAQVQPWWHDLADGDGGASA
jgi:hypothetical protein